MHKSKLKQMTLAVSLACFTLYAEAAGLGKLTVLSGLGEPLNAEIEVESATPDEIGSLSAAVASPEAYAVQGLPRGAIQENVQIAVGKKANGNPVLKLTSTQPVNDPFLDMLIQVDWSTGRLVREYTLLLDPPGYNADTVTPSAPAVVSAPVTSSKPVTPVNKPLTEAVITENGIKAVDEKTEQKSPVDEVKTHRGDTLSKIAKEMQVEGVSLDRMLVGLYRENKDAFVNGNMNQLKVGQIIKLPSAEQLNSISRKEAAQEIKVHASDWNGYKNKLAGAVAESKPAPEESKSQKATGTLATPKLDKPAVPAEGPKDVVKLSKTEEQPKKGDAKTDAKTFRNKLDALQEETVAREKGIKEASDRAAALEKQIDDLQKLMTLKNKSMADAQKQAAEVAKPKEPVKVAEVKKEEVKPATEEKKTETVAKVEEAKPAEKIAAEATEKPDEAVKPVEVKKPEATKKPKKHKAPKKVEEPEEEAGFFDSFDPVMLGGAGGLIAVLAGGWFYLRNRRKQSLDSFEKGILTAGALKANTVFGNTSGGTVDTGDTSFLTDFSQTAGGMIDTHDVDPIAEAEVYMAYGREAQAEEILKDAISKEPTRYELHLKLLEIYANRNDSSAFEATAGELYTTLGATHPVWMKVAEMGHAMEPNNPLYDIASGASAGAAAQDSVESKPAASQDMEATQILNVNDFAQAEVLDDASLDFSLDAAPEVAKNADNSLDMDFDLQVPVVEESAPAAVAELVDDNSLDFQLDMSALEDSTASADVTLSELDSNADVSASFDQTMPSLAATSFESPAFESPSADDVKMSAEDVTLASDSGLDFNFDLAETSEIAEIKTEDASTTLSFDDAEVTSIDMSAVDLGQSSAAEGDESEDVNTKLDLVTAYIDMGDNEGAKELLDEIIKEGGPKQIAKAKRLLADIA